MEKNSRQATDRRWPIILAGNALLRTAGGAGSVVIGLYFADQANRGQNVSPALVGMLNAVWYAAEIVAALSMGVLADRLAPHVLMVVGGLLGAMGMGLLGFTRFVPAFFFSRTLEGAAGGASAPSILAYLTDITEEAQEFRGRLMAFFELTLVGGIALGGPIGAKLWQRLGTGAFFALGAVYILSSAAFSLGASKNKARSTEEAFDGLKRALADSSVRALAPPWLAINAIIGLWLGPMLTFLLTRRQQSSQYLNGLFADQPDQVGWVFLGYSALFAAGIAVWSIFLDRIRRKRVLNIGLTAMLAACAGLFVLNHSGSWSGTSRLGLLILIGAAVMVESGFTPAALALLADVVGGMAGRGAAMGIYSALLGVGALIGALLGSLLGAQFGVDGLILGTSVLAVAALWTVQNLPATRVRTA